MGIPHQAFNCKFIMICFIMILSSLSNANTANAYDSLFIVEGVKIDITAKNAVLAQEQAFEKAQSKAFIVLAKRMVEEAQVQNVKTPDSLTISSLVKDYEITNEQLSAVRYVGTYTFRFREDAVSKYFSVSGVSFTNESSKTLLVLPILQKGGKSILWSEGNIWLDAWARARLSSGLVPVEVPIGDLMDIADINEDKALRYERASLDRMLARYNAKEAAIMIATADADLLNGGDLRISIYRTDRMNAQHVRDIIIPANKGESLKQVYARGVEKSYSALQSDWKNKTLSSASQSQKFYVRASFNNIRQWVRVRQALNDIGSISDISVLSISKKNAHISFKFRGDEEHLRDALSRSNLSIGQGYENAASKIIYNLTYSKNNSNSYKF